LTTEDFGPDFVTDGAGNPIMRLDVALDVLADSPDYFVEAIRWIRKNGWAGKDPKVFIFQPKARCISNACTDVMVGAGRSLSTLSDQRAAVTSVLCQAAGVSAIGYLFVLNDNQEPAEGPRWAKRVLAKAHRLVVERRANG
jgi:hypothetical protein